MKAGAFIPVHVPSFASSSLQHARHLRSHSLPANQCLSRGKQPLVGVTSSGLLVNQEVKCTWPALTRGKGGSKTSIKGRIERKNRLEKVECEMIKQQLKFCVLLCVSIHICKGKKGDFDSSPCPQSSWSDFLLFFIMISLCLAHIVLTFYQGSNTRSLLLHKVRILS